MWLKTIFFANLYLAYGITCVIGAENNLEKMESENLTRRQKISEPDTIYKQILESEIAAKTMLIVDVDGTLTWEEDPSVSKSTTQRGNCVKNIQNLIQLGTRVLFCSAWDVLEETKYRLQKIGFTNENLCIEENMSTDFGVKKLSLTDQFSVEIRYQQQGRIVSTKLFSSTDRFYRHKAFAPLLTDLQSLDTIEKICFLDDSPRNIDYFKKNIQQFNLYLGKKIEIYEVIKPKFSILND